MKSIDNVRARKRAIAGWGNAFSYDGFGNINGQTFTPGQAATPGTQGLPGGDANGDSGGGFDVENRYLGAPVGYAQTYWYDPWGKRVKICCQRDQYYNEYDQYTFYGIDGRPLSTFGAVGNPDGTNSNWPISTNLYFGGTLIKANGQWVSTDRLGSVRWNQISGSIAYYPYGQERTSTPDNTNKFGTYFRDVNYNGLGQDYADQRYYNNKTGNFWSPDPAGIASVDPKNPTSWNRYSYALDDPIQLVDRNGLSACDPDICDGFTSSDDSSDGVDCLAYPDASGCALTLSEASAYDPNSPCYGNAFVAQGYVNCGSPSEDSEDDDVVPCDPGFLANGIGGFSASDVNFAARAIFAESSGNYNEDLAMGDVIVNRLNNPAFSGGSLTTLTAVVTAPRQFNAVTPPGPNGQFLASAPGSYENLDPADCANLASAVRAMAAIAQSGATATYDMFAAASSGASGTKIGGSVFWTHRPPPKPKAPPKRKRKR